MTTFLTKESAQGLARNALSLTPIFVTVNTAIQSAATTGLYTSVTTLTGANIAIGPKLVEFYAVQGFSAVLSGTNDEILTVNWDA